MEAEAAGTPILEIVAQRERDGAEGYPVPGYLLLREEPYLQRFVSRGEIEIEEARAIDDMHLADVRHVDQREHLPDRNAGARFLEGFASGGGSRRLRVLHEAGGQGPEAVTGFDCPSAQQDAIVPLGYRPDHEFGIHVVNRPARVTNVTRQAIACRDSKIEGLSAA